VYKNSRSTIIEDMAIERRIRRTTSQVSNSLCIQ